MDQIKLDKMGTNRGSAPTATGKWILVEFSYEVKPDPAKDKSTHLDEVQFKVSVEGTEGDGDRKSTKTVILSGEVTYMVVPVGKGFGSMYIPADVAALYHIDKYMSKYNVNVQVFVGGQLVDSKDKKSDDENWFARPDYKNIPGMLLNKQQSPFVVNDTDRYPTIKPKQGN